MKAFNALLLFAILAAVSCTKAPDPKVLQFDVTGTTLSIHGDLGPSSKLTAEEWKKKLQIGAKILDNK